MTASRRTTEWFDDESLWQVLFPVFFSPARFAEATQAVDNVIRLARPQGMKALDLCCGPGRYSLVLAQRGFIVTGVDRTAFLLDEAARRARSEKLSIEWVRQDMRDFVRSGAFDIALNMYTSFGYFADRREDSQVLKNVFESLRPGGVFLMELMGKEVLAKCFIESSAHTQPDGSIVVEQRKIIDDWTRCANDWTLIRTDDIRRFSFVLNLYSGSELRQELTTAGFEVVELFGNRAGEPYGPQAARLVAVGRKPQ